MSQLDKISQFDSIIPTDGNTVDLYKVSQHQRKKANKKDVARYPSSDSALGLVDITKDLADSAAVLAGISATGGFVTPADNKKTRIDELAAIASLAKTEFKETIKAKPTYGKALTVKGKTAVPQLLITKTKKNAFERKSKQFVENALALKIAEYGYIDAAADPIKREAFNKYAIDLERVQARAHLYADIKKYTQEEKISAKNTSNVKLKQSKIGSEVAKIAVELFDLENDIIDLVNAKNFTGLPDPAVTAKILQYHENAATLDGIFQQNSVENPYKTNPLIAEIEKPAGHDFSKFEEVSGGKLQSLIAINAEPKQTYVAKAGAEYDAARTAIAKLPASSLEIEKQKLEKDLLAIKSLNENKHKLDAAGKHAFNKKFPNKHLKRNLLTGFFAPIALSTTISSIVGAATGTAVLPIFGTLAGAIAGAISGVIIGAAIGIAGAIGAFFTHKKYWKEKERRFKDEFVKTQKAKETELVKAIADIDKTIGKTKSVTEDKIAKIIQDNPDININDSKIISDAKEAVVKEVMNHGKKFNNMTSKDASR